MKATEQLVIYITEPNAWTVRKTDGSAIWRWLHEKQSAKGCRNNIVAIVCLVVATATANGIASFQGIKQSKT